MNFWCSLLLDHNTFKILIKLQIFYKLPFHRESKKEVHGYCDRVVRHEVSCSAKKWSNSPIPKKITIHDHFSLLLRKSILLFQFMMRWLFLFNQEVITKKVYFSVLLFISLGTLKNILMKIKQSLQMQCTLRFLLKPWKIIR